MILSVYLSLCKNLCIYIYTYLSHLDIYIYIYIYIHIYIYRERERVFCKLICIHLRIGSGVCYTSIMSTAEGDSSGFCSKCTLAIQP